MEGYSLSRNYEMLWKLIHNGFRIPAWVLNKRLSKDYRDICEVKMRGEDYMIGVRGIGYEGEQSKKGFMETCKMFDLQFSIPWQLDSESNCLTDSQWFNLESQISLAITKQNPGTHPESKPNRLAAKEIIKFLRENYNLDKKY